MENDTFIEKYSMTFKEFVDNVLNYTFIDSMVFSTDIEEFVNEYLNLDKLNKDSLLNNVYKYLLQNKDDDIFDENIKGNIYFLIDYLLEKNDVVKIKQQNAMINEIKLLTNNSKLNNLKYLREQILLREHAFVNYHFNRFLINRVPAFTILEDKDVYYNSISNDFLTLDLLLMDDNSFYEEYKKCLLQIDFYRSVNFFASVYELLFKKKSYLERVKFIIEQNRSLINAGEPVDKGFIVLQKVTQKVVKKIERQNK